MTYVPSHLYHILFELLKVYLLYIVICGVFFYNENHCGYPLLCNAFNVYIRYFFTRQHYVLQYVVHV